MTRETIPNWRQEWDRLAGGYKYLRIKNWERFQEQGRIHDWIKDWLAKDEDPEYGSREVRVLRRWMMDRLRRYCAVIKQNLPNDPELLIARMNLHPKDANQAGWTLVELLTPTSSRPEADQQPTAGRPKVDQAFLTPTNEQDRFLNKDNNKNNSKSTNSSSSLSLCTAEEPSPVQQPEPANPVQQTPPTGAALSVRSSEAEQTSPKPKSLREWDEDLPPYSAEHIRAAIRYHLDVNKKSWYRENLTSGFLRRGGNLKRMMDDVPESHWRPKATQAAKSYRWSPI